MRIDSTVKAYNKTTRQYLKSNPGRSTFWINEFNYFSKLMKNGKVIDIGCGPGFDSLLFTKNGYKYIGIDASDEFLKVARKLNSKAEFYLMDFNHLKFPEKSFEGFWACASLQHAKRAKIGSVLDQIWGILKPGGIGFIVVKERNGGTKEENVFDPRYNTKRYFAFYDLPEFKTILKKSGFKVLKSEKLNYKSTTRSWMSFFVKKP